MRGAPSHAMKLQSQSADARALDAGNNLRVAIVSGTPIQLCHLRKKALVDMLDKLWHRVEVPVIGCVELCAA